MLGVLGGMGPIATLDFVTKVIRLTPAQRDQDHLPMTVSLAVEIPDRTNAILGVGPDPFPAMLDALRRLEAGGVDCIAIPCNTAHHWHTALQAETSLPILHIVDAVLDVLRDRQPGRIGILATTGTMIAGIYQRALSERGIQWLVPDEFGQQDVMRAVKLVKGGNVSDATTILTREACTLVAAGCRYVVMGCTEVPVALANADPALANSLVDATEALAIASVRKAAALCKRGGTPMVA